MRRVALVVVAALIAFPLTTAVAAPTRLRRTHSPTLAASDALARAFQNGRLSRAELALERARSLFELREVRAEYGDVARPDPHSATHLLMDLALSLRELSGQDRERAAQILARPTDPTGSGLVGPYETTEAPPLCTTNLCVHYVTTTNDAPATATWHQDTSAIFEEVWNQEINVMGYRAPKSDLSSTEDGGNGQFDVYIQELGQFGVYGYCTTDDPKLNTNGVFFDVSSYCVVDDDYPPEQYPATNGLDAMRVTAAHEFFHAVQFGYDATEDPWLKEATASWMEDEVYDTINDSVQYLERGPLAFPHLPLDTLTEGTEPYGSYEYGAWVFFRHLSEQDSPFGAEAIHDIWTRLDSKTRDFRDVYSLKAMQQMAAARGTSVRDLYARFAAEALAPTVFFEEGAENSYPSPPIHRTVDLTTTSPLSSSANVTLDHLSSRYIAFTPGADVGADQRMTMAVDLPDTVKGSEATVVVMKTGVPPDIQPLTLDTDGTGNITVDFGRGVVERVVLVLSNGSIRFGSDCFRYTTVFSCGGATPTDDNQIFAYAAQLGEEAPPVTGGADITPPRITNVSDGPDPFRPNGTRTVKIRWTLTEDAFMKITITNSSGTRVLTFTRSIPADEYFFTWNGVFRNKLTKAGKHTYKLSAVDAAGNKSSVKKGTFTVKR